MDTMNDYTSWTDRDLYDNMGSKVGSITDVFTDDASGRPEWLAVKTGWFGTNISLVPIQGVSVRDTEDDRQDLVTNLDKDTIKNAPNVDAEGSLSQADEQMLYRHYGYDWNDRQSGNFGYGKDYAKAVRFDALYDQDRKKDMETTTQTVNASARVEVPIQADVRLRRYTTQGTRTVTVPTSEEHVEVAGIDAKTQQAQPAQAQTAGRRI